MAAVVALWLLAVVCIVFGKYHSHVSRPANVLIGFFTVSLVVGFSLWALYPRATMDDKRIELRGLRARERLESPLDRVLAYRRDKKGDWWVETEDRRARVGVQEPWELHRAFVELAPKKLHAKKMRFPGVAPAEEFMGLWTFDVEWLALRAKTTIGVLLVVLAIERKAGFGLTGQLCALLFFPAIEGWGRLDITRDGLVRRGPRHRYSIPWAEAQAIFEERKGGKRSFVVVGAGHAIEIPAHLAIEREVMEKVLYSFPTAILCVNFDETTLRGYRRRKRAKEPVKRDDLLPALTA